MKHKDVVVGETYMARVSGELVRVRVTAEITAENWRSGRMTRAFRVATMDGRYLPKSRTAVALRPVSAPPWTEEWETRRQDLRACRRAGQFDRADMLAEVMRGLAAARGRGARYLAAVSRMRREGVAL